MAISGSNQWTIGGQPAPETNFAGLPINAPTTEPETAVEVQETRQDRIASSRERRANVQTARKARLVGQVSGESPTAVKTSSALDSAGVFSGSVSPTPTTLGSTSSLFT